MLLFVQYYIVFFVLGFLFGKERKKEIVPKAKEEEIPLFSDSFSVTRTKNPTALEQWINIMNYCGESQTEGDYEETE